MEIEVGEFVRTYNGIIGTINKIEPIGKGLRYAGEYSSEEIIQINDGRVYERRLKRNNIVKHSKHIIDLIEVGDYVNGYKIVETYTDSKKEDEVWLGVVVSSKMIKEPLQEYFDSEMIKTILTHEQYKQNCYKVEE